MPEVRERLHPDASIKRVDAGKAARSRGHGTRFDSDKGTQRRAEEACTDVHESRRRMSASDASAARAADADEDGRGMAMTIRNFIQ